jgi:hypothetical protein
MDDKDAEILEGEDVKLRAQGSGLRAQGSEKNIQLEAIF